MILKQGFHTHPKTVMLRNRGGSQAVEALQQIWLFAENSRQWKFSNWTDEFVSAVGSIYGKPDLASLLVQVGFLDPLEGGGYALHDFDTHNAVLIQRWENRRFGHLGGAHGAKGGRPKNPRETPGGGFQKPPVGGPKNPPTRPDQTRPEKEGGGEGRARDGFSSVQEISPPIDPPVGFPQSEAQAREQAKGQGVLPEVAGRAWTLAASRGWRDARDIPIRSWPHYVAHCQSRERDRQAEQNYKNGRAPKEIKSRIEIPLL